MARSFRPLILCSAFAALVVNTFAEPATPEPQKKRRKDQEQPTPAPASPEFENVRKALDALTPEQRKRFQENFVRWANLSPEEKKALSDREELRKKVISQEVEAAIQEAGLQLEGDRKNQFVKRYAQERRKIEEQLRKETMEKRKPMVKDMIARLKSEFSGENTPANGQPVTDVAPVAPAK